MIKLHQMQQSGNCYKLRLLMGHLGIPFETVEVDILNGETKTPDFLAKNPNGKVPLLELGQDIYLPESNAGLFFLAQGSQFFPSEKLARAQALQWMFFEQYSHEPYIAVARFWRVFVENGAEQKADLFPTWWEKGYLALDVMEQHLAGQDWFAGDDFSIADIALYAYTHKAEEGGFDLSKYRHINLWLDRVCSVPGHKNIDWQPNASVT